MLLDIFLPLVKYVSAFNIFRYITFRTAAALVFALIICFIIGPKLIAYLRRVKAGQNIRTDGPQTHHTKSGTPTMGGVLILIGLIVSMLFFGNLSNPYVIIVLIATVQFGIIGFVDDYLKIVRKDTRGLPGRYKILMQCIVSFSVVGALFLNPMASPDLTKLSIPFFGDFSIDLDWLYVPFAMLVLVGASNSVNLSDGLDGLAIGLTLFVAMAFAAIAYVTGHFNIATYLKIPFLPGSAELAVFCGALLGAGLGFLWFNSHPAEIFMGDTGSLSLGGALGLIALMLKKELLLVLIGGVFVAEALSVIIQVGVYKLKGRRVFRMAPLHHHYELKGWHENKVITRFWIVGLLLAILALATLKVR
jgi:phospho-N-acetylmuramoyl-pentapeptide-transferase